MISPSLKSQINPSSVQMINADATVYAACQLMDSHNIGAIIVTQNNEIQGIMTERDLLNKIAAKGLDYKSIKVREIMTRKLLTVTSEDTVQTCYEIMVDAGLRHLPVIENGEVINIISIRDVLDIMINHLTALVNKHEAELSRTNKMLSTMMHGDNQ